MHRIAFIFTENVLWVDTGVSISWHDNRLLCTLFDFLSVRNFSGFKAGVPKFNFFG